MPAHDPAQRRINARDELIAAVHSWTATYGDLVDDADDFAERVARLFDAEQHD